MEEEIVFCKYNQAEEKDYVWTGCSCSLRPDWGYRIKRTSLDRFVKFRCPQCQSQVSMFVPAKKGESMKPYTEKIEEFAGQFKEQMASLYEQGYKDGSTIYGEGSLGATLAEKKGYAHGLSDAWECAKKIACYKLDGGLAEDELLTIFGTQFISQIFGMFDVSDAIAKIKEYKEQKDPDRLRCLRFYDEIIYDGNHRGVIIDIASNGIKWVLDSDGSVQALDHDVSYRITGRQFPEILDILDRLQEGGADE